MPPPRLEIRYCPRCGWLLRAAWLAQEALSTFPDELGEAALLPADPGTFQIWLDSERLFCRREAGRFPEPREIKLALRDRIAPGRDLGHSERKERTE